MAEEIKRSVTPAPSVAHYSTSPMITLIAGGGDKDTDSTEIIHPQQQFRVHRDLLMRSSFFAACLTHKFREADAQVIELPEDSPAAVAHFIEWLYSGRCPVTRYIEDLEHHLGCADIYAFGDKVCTEVYTNQIMDDWIKCVRDVSGYVTPSDLACLYRHGLRGTKLAELGLQSAVLQASHNPKNFMRKEHGYESDWFSVPELMRDFMDKMLEFRLAPWADPVRKEKCTWHQHKDGVRCGGNS